MGALTAVGKDAAAAADESAQQTLRWLSCGILGVAALVVALCGAIVGRRRNRSRSEPSQALLEWLLRRYDLDCDGFLGQQEYSLFAEDIGYVNAMVMRAVRRRG
eukprot:COSAG05_NODE_2211_length_3385_cov_160.566590_3_plen_104_part_00